MKLGIFAEHQLHTLVCRIFTEPKKAFLIDTTPLSLQQSVKVIV